MPDNEPNHWFDRKCARIYWDQHKALPYQQLLKDTTQWLSPGAGQHWLDLGCGGGQLTAAIWRQSQGEVGQIVAVDCAEVNGEKIAQLRAQLKPKRDDQIRFAAGDFSQGLPQLSTGTFDGIVSGLAISYAEWKDPSTGRYTDHAYNRLLAEMYRVLKPDGVLVFSVPVPNPKFWRILWRSLRLAFKVSRPGKALINGLRMQRYGSWLQREAQRGRFHYYPIEDIAARLKSVGFREFKHRLSFADQAYLVSVRKPGRASVAA